jgi:hypothetical protein
MPHADRRSFWAALLGARKAVPAAAPEGAAHQGLLVRRAGPSDLEAVAALARLEGERPPYGRVLLAEVAGRAWAAISLDDGHLVADPRLPTGELAWQLVERARRERPWAA